MTKENTYWVLCQITKDITTPPYYKEFCIKAERVNRETLLRWKTKLGEKGAVNTIIINWKKLDE